MIGENLRLIDGYVGASQGRIKGKFEVEEENGGKVNREDLK